ncbi:hypothetical protein [Flavisphingomonas formosensis]|uniref:hypothetical protein n=1 Tax=Flavisphingomonas formosensis TaxID=861534 RepID=UPI0012FA232D|nr:hypothetical protein [Sphingomonas formosensis]
MRTLARQIWVHRPDARAGEFTLAHDAGSTTTALFVANGATTAGKTVMALTLAGLACDYILGQVPNPERSA